MANYVDTGTQTIWKGLMQRETVRPDMLLSPPHDTATPPDEMVTAKSQFLYGGVIPNIASPQPPQENRNPSSTLTLLDRRQNRAGLDPHISLPRMSSGVIDEDPLSPPPTHALLSPLPEANKRHAGHTPLFPRALSPELEAAEEVAKAQPFEQQTAEDKAVTPDLDEGLDGPLILPTNPVDGTQDHIGLDALDQRLGKIAKQQAVLRGEFDDAPDLEPKAGPKEQALDANEDGLPLSRKGSADSRRSGATDELDGVILKSPPSNFGAPLGQL